jgi:hypothetical protein
MQRRKPSIVVTLLLLTAAVSSASIARAGTFLTGTALY